MKELLLQIEFAKPLFLWLILGLPLLWLRFRDQRPVVILGRTLVLLLLIFALADPQRLTPQTRAEQRLFAFDISQSVTTGMRRWMEGTAQGELKPRPEDRVFVFASDAKETLAWRESLTGERGAQQPVPTAKTSLEKLLAALLALSAAPRSVFLFTDGWETEGNIERLLPAIAASGLKIFPIVPTEPAKIDNVAVTKLVVPNQGKSG